ncbi:MAG TPA: MarR family transcriptional regulator [Candidatus Aquilonibacter sp.]|nr:MarR family transcriptional regulator [Candidatus Aquilonibacter sp.]
MSHRPAPEEKTQRAFRAYLDLIDTAAWLRGELRVPLEAFDLTMPGFRLLELLNREGAQRRKDLPERFGVRRQAMDDVIERLEKRNWVGRAIVTLPPVEFERSHLAKSRRDEARAGRPMHAVALTKLGKKFIKDVLPTHSKMVKSLLRVLDAREQNTLSRICRKLREGDVVKFVRELTTEREGE